MKKQLADNFEVERKTSKALRIIRELEVSLTAARTSFERAKNAYQLRWGEEQCCKVNRVELSNIVNQLALSKEETGAIKRVEHAQRSLRKLQKAEVEAS